MLVLKMHLRTEDETSTLNMGYYGARARNLIGIFEAFPRDCVKVSDHLNG
jgi:hypothetical protein